MTHDALYSSYTPLNFPIFLTARCAGANDATHQAMDPETLRIFTKQYIDAQIHSAVSFLWSGGEPTQCGIEFFRTAVDLQRQAAPNRTILNTICTNAAIIDEEWCRFLKENNFRMHVCLDGPEFCHDASCAGLEGHSRFADTMRGLSLLRAHDIPVLIRSTVSAGNVHYPTEVYNFYKKNGLRQISFAPVTASKHDPMADYAITGEQWGNFLCAIYDEWVRHDVGRMHIDVFDNALRIFCRQEPLACVCSPTCGHLAMVDAGGDIYSCRYFCKPDNRLGNIREQTITGMMYGRKQLRFGQQKRSALTLQCKRCAHLRLCHGGCPKDRIGVSTGGEKRHNILCSGLTRFFDHITPSMTFMAEEIFTHGDSARIMSFFETAPND